MNRKFITTGYSKLMKIKLLALLILISFFTGCEKEKKEIIEEEVIIARVGNSILTETKLGQMLRFTENAGKYKEEIISHWVETELLYLQAVENEIVEDTLYKRISRASNKKLAGSLYLNDYLKSNKVEKNISELEEYYNNNKTEFAIDDQAYHYNLVEFDLESFFKGPDNFTIIDELSSDLKENFPDSLNIAKVFKLRSDIESKNILNAIDTLEVNEISVIPNSEPGIVSIVQLTQKYEKGSIPEFRLIKNVVEERFNDYNKMLLYDKLIRDLYTQYNVIINR